MDLVHFSALSTWLIFTWEGECCIFDGPLFKNLTQRLWLPLSLLLLLGVLLLPLPW